MAQKMQKKNATRFGLKLIFLGEFDLIITRATIIIKI